MSVVLICEPGLVMLIFSESKQSPQKITKKIPDYQQLLCSVFCNLQYTFKKYLWNSSLFTVKIIKPPGMNTVTSFLQKRINVSCGTAAMLKELSTFFFQGAHVTGHLACFSSLQSNYKVYRHIIFVQQEK